MEEVSNVDLRISEAVASLFTNPKVTAEDLRERYNDELQGMMMENLEIPFKPKPILFGTLYVT